MARSQFETIVASASREKLQLSDLTDSTPIGTSSQQTTLVYAPPGYVGEVMGWYFNCGAITGATSGTHFAGLGYTMGGITMFLIQGVSNFGSFIKWDGSYWMVADASGTGQLPPANHTQVNAIKGVTFDDTTPLRIIYKNIGNTTQNATRTCALMYKLKQIAK